MLHLIEVEVLAIVERGGTISELATNAVGGLVETDDDRTSNWDVFQDLAVDYELRLS